MAIKSGETTYHQAKRGIVQNGLVLNLDAGVGASYNNGASWLDLSPDKRSASFSNGPVFDRDHGGFIYYDGSDDVSSLGDSSDELLLNTTGSACCWINFPSIPQGGTSHIISKRGHSNANSSRIWYLSGYGQGSGGGAPRVYSNGVYTSNSTIVYNTWQLLCSTWTGGNGGTTSIYINGSLSNSGTSSIGSQSQTGQAVDIGRYGYSFGAKRIAGIQLYNRALTATEITQNYNATRHRFGV